MHGFYVDLWACHPQGLVAPGSYPQGSLCEWWRGSTQA